MDITGDFSFRKPERDRYATSHCSHWSVKDTKRIPINNIASLRIPFRQFVPTTYLCWIARKKRLYSSLAFLRVEFDVVEFRRILTKWRTIFWNTETSLNMEIGAEMAWLCALACRPGLKYSVFLQKISTQATGTWGRPGTMRSWQTPHFLWTRGGTDRGSNCWK